MIMMIGELQVAALLLV